MLKTGRPKTPPKWHLVYYLLASFDLLTIAGSLYLNHTMMDIYTQSVQVNRAWAEQIIDLSDLSEVAQSTNGPGNDIFDTKNVDLERARRNRYLKEFDIKLDTVAINLASLIGASESSQDFGPYFADIRSSMADMVEEADQIFVYFEDGQELKAGSRIAAMDRDYAALVNSIRAIIRRVSDIQAEVFDREIKKAETLRQYEFLFGFCIILIVLTVTIYGHKIAQAIRTSYEAEMKAAEEAERASMTKTVFLTNMSHEIRTPMNGILMSLSLARNSVDDEEKHHLLQTAENSADTLLHIINDVLDLSKLDAGKLTMHKEPTRVRRMLVQTTELMRPLAEEKGLDFSLKLGALPRFLSLDEGRVSQIVYNLVSNAIKFTEKGCVCVAASYDDGVLTIDVEDSGKGISEEDRAKLFERFAQFDQNKGGLKGTGLGLAISRQLAQLMGGDLHATSDLGVGSHFWLTLPADECADMSEKIAEIEKGAVQKCYKILVAEDIKINQMLIGKMLKGMGHSVEVVDDGQQAVDRVLAAAVGDIDLILMDNQMPVLMGDEATKIIRSSDHPMSAIPIIALTADAMEEQRQAFVRAGMNGFVPKPVIADKLDSEITRVMESV